MSPSLRLSLLLSLSLLASFCLLPSSAEFIEDASRFPLSTNKNKIVDSSGVPVHLQCVNWYGAHMETFVVGGLEALPLAENAAAIRAQGFNCVRLVFSLELALGQNLAVPAVALAANPDLVGKTPMEIFDLTIEAITDQKIMVLMNNHNSKSGWCCDVNSEEGLWSTPEYPAEMWLTVLASFAERYKSNPYVIGIDIRNEIHDVAPANRYIDWGVTRDIDSDWKFATETAAQKIYDKNPDWLIVVSGLCFSFDLRLLVLDLPRIPQVAKLVWTTHYYEGSMWWSRAEEQLNFTWKSAASSAAAAAAVAGVSLALIASCYAVAARRRSRRDPSLRPPLVPSGPLVTASAVLVSIGMWLVAAFSVLDAVTVVVRGGYATAGCNNMALEADIMDEVALALKIISGLSFGGAIAAMVWGEKVDRSAVREWGSRNGADKGIELKSLTGRNKDDEATVDSLVSREGDSKLGDDDAVTPALLERTAGLGRCFFLSFEFLVFVCFFNMVVLVSVVFIASLAFNSFANKASGYEMLHDELSTKWQLDNHAAPVIVGEFGTACDGVDRKWWKFMTRFLDEKDLSWSYWPWNAARWDVWTNTFGEDFYSIINMDAHTPRCEPLLDRLQEIQHP